MHMCRIKPSFREVRGRVVLISGKVFNEVSVEEVDWSLPASYARAAQELVVWKETVLDTYLVLL